MHFDSPLSIHGTQVFLLGTLFGFGMAFLIQNMFVSLMRWLRK